MGASRRAHHRAEEAKRAAGIEATAMRIAQENQQKEYQAMIDALKPQAAVDIARPPRPIQSTIDDARGGIRTARSTRGTVKGLSRGLAQLRIPLNIGGGAGGGLNIG
jgi:hypothetical protein